MIPKSLIDVTISIFSSWSVYEKLFLIFPNFMCFVFLIEKFN
jgi:hypothetical protein